MALILTDKLLGHPKIIHHTNTALSEIPRSYPKTSFIRRREQAR